MKIWIDADACPGIIKEILFRASKRKSIPLILVANQFITTPASPLIKKIQVMGGFDEADNYIIEHAQAGDLIITADIPLADKVIEKGAQALNPRGELYTQDNIKQRLSLRHLNEEVRSIGIQTRGAPKMSNKESTHFANALDKILARYRPGV